MSTPDSDGVTGLDGDAMTALAGTLGAAATQIQLNAGGVPRQGPDVPYDWFELHGKITALDEAREAFDLRVAGFVRSHADGASEQLRDTQAADTFSGPR
jgi:hypothetical protein